MAPYYTVFFYDILIFYNWNFGCVHLFCLLYGKRHHGAICKQSWNQKAIFCYFLTEPLFILLGFCSLLCKVEQFQLFLKTPFLSKWMNMRSIIESQFQEWKYNHYAISCNVYKLSFLFNLCQLFCFLCVKPK